MTVEYGRYESEPELKSGTLVAEDTDAWLISDTNHDTDEIQLSDIDRKPGRVRIHQYDETDDELSYTDMVFDSFHLARLTYGLWLRCGPFNQPEGNAVPVEIATDGQAAVGAFLRIGNGYPNSREYVADKMEVSKQTVSNYANRISWSPDQ